MELRQEKNIYSVHWRTGANATRIEPSSMSWSTRLNKPGEVSVDTTVTEHDLDYDELRRITNVKQYGLVLEVDGELVEGGQIASRNNESGKVDGIVAPGIMAYLERVHVHSSTFNPSTDDATADVVSFSGMSWRGLAGAVLMEVVNNPNYQLPPIVCDFAGEVGDHAITFNGIDFKSISDAMTEIMDMPSGPDLQIIPEWTDEYRQSVHWRLIGGTPLLMQEGDPQLLEVTAPESGVSKLGVDEDGTEVLTRIWATSSVEGVGTLVGTNGSLVSDGFALMEAHEEFEAASLAELQEMLDARLQETSSSMSTWSLDISADDVVEFLPGDFINIFTEGYRTVPDGVRLVRVVGKDGDHSQSVKIHLQPMLTTWENFDPNKIQRRYTEPDPLTADDEHERDTQKAISSAAKTGGTKTSSAAAFSLGIVSEVPEIEDDASYKVDLKDITGQSTGKSKWVYDYQNIRPSIGDEVLIGIQNENTSYILGVWNGANRGGGAAAELGVVASAQNDVLDASVTIDGNNYPALNYTRMLLASGDDVAVVTTTSGQRLILGKGLSSDGTLGVWEPARVSLGFPFPTGEIGMATINSSGHENIQAYVDITDATGHGSGAMGIDLPVVNTIYPQPSTGVFAALGTPGGDWVWIPRSIFIKEGKLFQWFNHAAKQYPYLFMWNRGELKWDLVPGLPETRNVVGDGYWTELSVQGEMGNLPVVAMVSADPLAVSSMYKGYIQLWQVKPDGSGWTKSPKVSWNEQYLGFGSPGELTSESVWWASSIFNEGHFYVYTSFTSPNSRRKYHYVQASSGMTMATRTHLFDAQDGGATWHTWFESVGQYYYSSSMFRVDEDGFLYYVTTEEITDEYKTGINEIRKRKAGGGVIEGIWANSTSQGGQKMGMANVVKASGTKYLIAATRVSAISGQAVGVVMEYDFSTNAKTEVVGDATPPGLATEAYESQARVSMPTKTAMGDIVIIVGNSSAAPRAASEKMYKFIV